MKVYISGKITGIEEEALALFQHAECLLQGEGHQTINPINLPHDHDQSWHSFMREDIKALCDCDAIYMLKNWKDSKGAIIANEIANYIGLEVMYEI